MAALSSSVDSYNIIDHEDFFISGIPRLGEHGIVVGLSGTRASGKTHLLKYLLYHLKEKRKIDTAFIVSSTADHQFDSEAYSYVAKGLRFKTLDKGAEVLTKMKEIIEHNKKIQKMYKQNKPGNSGKPEYVVSRVALIIDDFAGMDLRNDEMITQLTTHGRHLSFKNEKGEVINRVDVFILSQDLTMMSPVQRQNMDLMLSSRTMSYRATKLTTEGFLTVGTDRKGGGQLLESLSRTPYMFAAVMITVQPKTNLKSYVYKAHAPAEIPDFRLGDPSLFEEEEEE